MRGKAKIVAAAAALFLLTSSSAPAASGSKPVCGPQRGTTLKEGRKARVYSLASSEPPWSERVYGCLHSSDHPWQLSPRDGDRRSPRLESETLALSAPWAGGVMRESGVDTFRLAVRARNLRTGAAVECEAGGGSAVFKEATIVKRLVLTTTGTIAWSSGVLRRNEESNRKILVCAPPLAQALDEGEGIDLNSLELHGSTLTWIDAGARRTARLP